MKRKKPLPSMTALTALLALCILGSWLVSMACLTVVAAQEIYDKLCDESVEFARRVTQSTPLDDYYDPDSFQYGAQTQRPDRWEYNILNAIARHPRYSVYSGGRYTTYRTQKLERHKLLDDIFYPMQTAVLFYDGEGKLLHSSDEDILYFDWYTQEEWEAGQDDTSGLHYAFLDISEGKGTDSDPWLRFRDLDSRTYIRDYDALRLTGWFEGNQLIPVALDYVTDDQVNAVLAQTDRFSPGPNSVSYTISALDKTGLLNWQSHFDRRAEYPGRELVTVYAEDILFWDYEKTPLSYDGEEYESLAALTRSLAEGGLDQSLTWEGQSTLKELLLFDRRLFQMDVTDGAGETELILVTAIRSHPLRCALRGLWKVYLGTGLLALALFWFARRKIRDKLISPVSEVARAMGKDWQKPFHPEPMPVFWAECEALYAGFAAESDRRRFKDNEITRLNTALDYAKQAEEDRRRMTSHLAHELKTPLAVIHSYAEGLSEHIAEDKREKYIGVILSEAERTDAMVLELLDLSRLEAGKVKLALDSVSLPALTRSVFDRFAPAAQGKRSTVTLSLPEKLTVTADEGRLTQVLENLASNAVKYTPPGGRIQVSLQVLRGGTLFTVENDSPPLSEETLSHLWDAFYRADETRVEPGTGLGLAIAKNILDLHGWPCFARNTKTGVAIGFQIK